jgi:hypothetical protein
LQVAEDIVSTFRIICVAALTASPLVLFADVFADVATAQSARPADQTGKPYLAGLRPPHASHKATHGKIDRDPKLASKKSQKPAAKVTNKIAKPSIKHAAVSTTHSTTHARGRGRTKLTSRIDWPQVDPITGEDRSMPPTALQFTADDTKASPSVTTTPAAKSAPAVKASPPKPPGEERNVVAPLGVDQSLPADKVNEAERFDASAPEIEQAAAPQSQPNAPAVEDSAARPQSIKPPRRTGSSVAQTLVMLAGAISAALVGCWVFGFGSSSSRGIRLGV